MNNYVEKIRKDVILDMFKIPTFAHAWSAWKTQIVQAIGDFSDPSRVINLGDHLKEIFGSTSENNRSQSQISSGGKAWECLVCWYMNLCLIGSRAVVLIPKKALVPEPLMHAISVNYGSFKSNSESDLLVLIFPKDFDLPIDIDVGDKSAIDSEIGKHFSKFGVGIIQCKTNWNDSAQIPMLWDMVYSSEGFGERGITIGSSLYSITDIAEFFYAFITVPTSKGPFKPQGTNVMRVRGLSGGNYWGQASSQSVAHSIKEIFGINLRNAFDKPLRDTLRESMLDLHSKHSYFIDV